MEDANELKKIVSGEVVTDEKILAQYSTDASLFRLEPQAVVKPQSVADIAALVRYASEQGDVSLTARSGGTGMDGGALSESIVVDFQKYFNTVGEVVQEGSGGFAVVQPGAWYRDFEKKTLAKNLLMPSYPASREICTVGGMVANNAGGEKTLSYGKTIDFVRELKVVLADGNEYTLKPLSGEELAAKKKQDDFEGEVYRNIHALLEKHHALIDQARPAVSKNSAGYYLWRVWDKEAGTFDLTQLFVGSQGTLGFITEITFDLVRPKAHTELLVVFLRDSGVLAHIVNTVLKYKPESFESYDDKTFKLVLRYFGGFVKQMGAKNIFKLAWQFLPEARMTLTKGFPRLILLAEFTSDDRADAKKRVQQAARALKEFNVGTHIVKNEEEAEKYWKIRREAFNLIRFHLKGNEKSVPFIDDLVVTPERLPEFLPGIYRLLAPYKHLLRYALGGHAGDGNFHIYTLMDVSRSEVRDAIPEIARKVYDFTLSLGGSITAEHNDGIIRTPFLKEQYGEEMYKLFEEVKNIFDPKGIFNPGKKVLSTRPARSGQVGGTMEYAISHMKGASTDSKS